MSIWGDGMFLSLAVFFGSLAAGVAGWWLSQHLERQRRLKGAHMGIEGLSEARDGPRTVLPFVSVGKPSRGKGGSVDRYVPEMMDALALGMRSGLSFESAFSLYHARFDDRLSHACADAQRKWEAGLLSREDALREMADELDNAMLRRFAANVARSLRFGSPLGRILEELSRESREAYRTTIEERVARAPVRMLVPTATLILPAMLAIVLGPVLLELL